MRQKEEREHQKGSSMPFPIGAGALMPPPLLLPPSPQERRPALGPSENDNDSWATVTLPIDGEDETLGLLQES